MKLEKVFKTILLPVTMICLISSCGDDFDFESHYPGEGVKKEYADNWVQQFGEIDPNQDWCMAKTASVEVSVSHESNIKVYAKNQEIFYLVGDYDLETGTHTLSFDMVKGNEDLYVSDGTKGHFARVGDSVTFENTTRGGITTDSRVDLSTEYFEFSHESALDYCLTELNKGGNTSDFTYVATEGSVIVYPMYWESNKPLVVGIYLEDGTMIPLFSNKIAYEDVLSFKNGSSFTQITTESVTSNTGVGRDNFKSTGLVINLPKNTRFGFYLYSGKEPYPTSSYQSNKVYKSEKGSQTVSHVSTITAVLGGENRTVVGLGEGGSSSNDYTDLVFAIDNVVTISNTVNSWFIACEDLGSTGDVDFNDLVFEVQVVSGRDNKAVLFPRAAGGILKAEYSLDNTNWYEIHNKLGHPNPTGEQYTMINTVPGGATGSCRESDYTNLLGKYTISDIFNRLKIRVYQDGITKDPIYINAPEIASAPQMIVAPTGWRWTKEKERIEDAYPYFIRWNIDATAQDWYFTGTVQYEMLY